MENTDGRNTMVPSVDDDSLRKIGELQHHSNDGKFLSFVIIYVCLLSNLATTAIKGIREISARILKTYFNERFKVYSV